MKKLGRILKNKNTVTILGILLIIALLFVGYTATVKNATNPVQVPVAAEKILPSTKITSQKIATKKVAKIMISDNVYQNAAQIIGLFTNVNVTIPKGSIFYKEWLVTADDLPGNWLNEVKISKGEEPYYYSINTEETYGNSIVPKTYIDIQMRTTINEKTVTGTLLRDIKVLAVHDKSGKNVFADSENIGVPAYLGFGLISENYSLLRRAEYLKAIGSISLKVIPHGKTYTTEKGETVVSSETLKQYIETYTAGVSDDEIQKALDAKRAEEDS